MTREEVGTLVEALLAVLDDRRNRGEISDREWTEMGELLSERAAGWLRDAADDGTTGDQSGIRCC